LTGRQSVELGSIIINRSLAVIALRAYGRLRIHQHLELVRLPLRTRWLWIASRLTKFDKLRHQLGEFTLTLITIAISPTCAHHAIAARPPP